MSRADRTPVERVLDLQRTAGNRATAALIASGVLARSPADEQAADTQWEKLSTRTHIEHLELELRERGVREDVLARIHAEHRRDRNGRLRALQELAWEVLEHPSAMGVPGGGPRPDSQMASSRFRDRMPQNEGHHPFPQYLGGAFDQTKIRLPHVVHYLYHEEVDKDLELPRKRRSRFYEAMSPQQREDMYKRLLEHAAEFDERYSKEYANPNARIEPLMRAAIEAREAGRSGPAGNGTPPQPAPAEELGQRVTPATVGMPDMEPVREGGPNAAGAAVADGIVLALQGLNFVFARYNEHVQLGRLEEALGALKPQVARITQQRPECGVLLAIRFRQAEGHPDSPIHPGPVFAGIDVGVGADPREAQRDMVSQPELRAGLAPGEHETIAEMRWIPPRRPQAPKVPPPPLPVFCLATFVSDTPELQNVEWTNLGGFDDEARTRLSLRPGVTPRFYVLQMPKWIHSVIPREQNPEQKETLLPLATRDGFPVVELDPLMPFFDVTAAALYPADQATLELSQQAPATVQMGPLLIDDFDLVRWARPDQIKTIAP